MWTTGWMRWTTNMRRENMYDDMRMRWTMYTWCVSWNQNGSFADLKTEERRRLMRSRQQREQQQEDLHSFMIWRDIKWLRELLNVSESNGFSGFVAEEMRDQGRERGRKKRQKSSVRQVSQGCIKVYKHHVMKYFRNWTDRSYLIRGRRTLLLSGYFSSLIISEHLSTRGRERG